MDPSSPPPPLQLLPLLADVSSWLSLPASSSEQPSSSTAASFISSANRQAGAAGGLLGGLLGGSNSSRSSLGDGGDGIETTRPEKRVRCRWVEGYGNNLYLGTSDGQVLWYTFDPHATSSDPYTLRHRHNLFPRKAVDRIYLLPSISKCLVHSESTLHFLTLPSLDPVPPALIQPIRGVVAVAIDEGHDVFMPEVGEEVGICVIKRKNMTIFRLGARLFHVKDVPLTSPPLVAKYFSPHLCIADHDLNSVVSLLDSSLYQVLPVAQVPPEERTFQPRPSIACVQANEFLITSCTSNDGTTMGIFINGDGDPQQERGMIEWESHPRSIVVEPPYIVSLLRNQTVQVHSLDPLELIQTIALPASVEARSLSRSPTGFLVPATERDEHLRKVMVTLLPPKPASPLSPLPLPSSTSTDGSFADPATQHSISSLEPTTLVSFADPPSGSGLTPPSSPRRSYNSTRTSSSSFSYNRSSFPSISSETSHILLTSPSSIHALAPTPPLTLALQSLSSSSSALSDALAPLLLSAAMSTSGEQDGDAIKFVHQKVFLRALREARFGEEQAEIWDFGGGDVRLLIRLFPELRGVLELELEIGGEYGAGGGGGDELEVETEEGLRGEWEHLWNIEDIIQENLKRNYSPHIEPDVASAPSTIELTNVLLAQAREMLRVILQQEREVRKRRPKNVNRSKKEEVLDLVVDTALLVLLSRIGTTSALLEILESTHHADMALVRSTLESENRWFALGRTQYGSEALETFTSVVEGTRHDDDCARDPMDEVLSILAGTEDVPLVRRYGLWVVRRDWERGLQLFIHSGLEFDHADLVDELRALDERAGDQYLEHVVVIKRSLDRDLHSSLANRYVSLLSSALQDATIQSQFSEAISTYTSSNSKPNPNPNPKLPSPSPAPISFLAFLSSHLPDSPARTLRFKTILFLQGSQRYDYDEIRQTLESDDATLGVLSLERAIVYGKLQNHPPALHLLARTLRDPISAEAYCTQGGEVLPGHLASALASSLHLTAWAELGGGAMKRRMTVSEETRKGLLMVLLRIYMGQGEGAATAHRTAQLLNDQAIHLDVEDVIDLIPNEWPLEPLSSFLTRSLRRTLHQKHEGQNLSITTFNAYEPFVHYPDDDDDDGPSADPSLSSSFDEKRALVAVDDEEEQDGVILSEKTPLKEERQDEPAAEIVVFGEKEGRRSSPTSVRDEVEGETDGLA